MRVLYSLGILCLFAAGLLLPSSCKHEPLLKLSKEDSAICFERDILPIFNSHCATKGCHDASTAEEGLILDSYNGIMAGGIKPGDPADSEIYKELSTGKMSRPQYGNLSQAQKDIIKKWIMLGAKNTTNCPTSCDSTKFTFSNAINPLIQAQCTGCHKPGNLGGGVDLTTHAGVQAVALNGKLMASFKRTKDWMPLGGKQLDACQMRQFEKWIANGAQND